MGRGTWRQRFESHLRRNPWALSLLSGVFVVGLLWAGSRVGWDPWAPVGYGVRHLPLWLLLGLGLPLFGAGVVVGAVRQARGPSDAARVRRPSAPEVRSSGEDGPGWLTRGQEARTAPTVYRATATLEPRGPFRRRTRVLRFDARWPNGLVEEDVDLVALLYRRAPADFDVTRRAMLEHCPEVGVGAWVQWPYGTVVGVDGGVDGGGPAS